MRKRGQYSYTFEKQVAECYLEYNLIYGEKKQTKKQSICMMEKPRRKNTNVLLVVVGFCFGVGHRGL